MARVAECEPEATKYQVYTTRIKMKKTKHPSKAAFFEMIGISEASYNHMARGGANPTIDTLVRIAASLGLTFFELVGNIDDATLAKRLKSAKLDVSVISWAAKAYDEAMAGFDAVAADNPLVAKRRKREVTK